MDQCHALWSGRDSILAYSSQKSPSMERARGQLPRPRHHRAEASWPIDQVRFSGTVRHAWGAMGESQMNSKLTKLAAAGVLSLCTAAPALAGSVTQPGETVGLNTGAPLPQGWYVINTVDWGCMGTQIRSTRVRVSPFRSSLGQRRGRFWARDYSSWGRGPRWKSACNATQASVCQAPTLTVCTIRWCRANWPGTSAMDGASATCLEPISSTVARWRGATPRSISGLR